MRPQKPEEVNWIWIFIKSERIKYLHEPGPEMPSYVHHSSQLALISEVTMDFEISLAMFNFVLLIQLFQDFLIYVVMLFFFQIFADESY